MWSNALAYRDVSLAPREQLSELAEIGEAIAGEGPTLMTEYSPYGARHFLRDADPESVVRAAPQDGSRGATARSCPRGRPPTPTRSIPTALGVYRTLVLRRSPAQSRPPAAYELVWRGEFYEAWQRQATTVPLPPRLPLGSAEDPVGRPRCADVLALARRAKELVVPTTPSAVVAPLASPASPAGPESVSAEARVDVGGAFELWLGGSVRPAVEALVDGDPVGTVRHELNNAGQYVAFGEVTLAPGVHRIELRFSGADLHPGSGGSVPDIGPLSLSRSEAADSNLVRVDAADARERLCGNEWDWIEAAYGLPVG